MSRSTSLLQAMDDRTIAQRVTWLHDEVRMRFPLRSNTTNDFGSFEQIIGDYTSYHYKECISRGGTLSPGEARSMAKGILEREYQRRRGNIVTAFNDARYGTNGGLRHILDIIADALKAQSVEHYLRDILDHIGASPDSWSEKVSLVRDFIVEYGAFLGPDIRPEDAPRFAASWEELIRAYVEGLRTTSSIFRCL